MKLLRTLFILLSAIVFTQTYVNAQQGSYGRVDSLVLKMPEGQTRTTTGIAEYIRTHFQADNERVRAAFVWVASTFSYDVKNMYELRMNETPEDKINKPLATHMGVCENYAAVFNDVCKKLGYNSVIVTGYNKVNGVTSFVPHAWCAVNYNGSWKLYDPTWASGRIYKGQFVRKLDNSFYEVKPEVLIKTHMPFDPMWQLSYEPIDNTEFKEGHPIAGKPQQHFNFTDTIATYQRMTQLGQLKTELSRVTRAVVNNVMVYDHAANLKSKIDFLEESEKVNKQNEMVNRYNSAVSDFNKAVKQLNDFIDYRNNQFSPMRPDNQIQAMVDSPANRLTIARDKLMAVKPGGNISDEMFNSFSASLNDIQRRLDEQQEFLDKYFKKSKLGRKTMFTKYTWMGLPLN